MEATTSNEVFSLDKRNPPGLKQNLGFFLLNTIVARLLRFVCRLAPMWHIPGTNVVLVTGFDGVQEIYSRHFDFEVPYEDRAEALRWHGFILALQDTPEYHDMFDNISRLWQPDDTTRVHEIARATTESILSRTHGDLDIIQDLAKPVFMAIVEQHYGVRMHPEQVQPFFDGNLAGSSFMFSKPPKISKKQLATGTAAVNGVWPVLDAAMAAARVNPDPTTVLGRYYAAGPDPSFPEAKLRSGLMTMIGGYLPTCTNATGRIMNTLLSDQNAMQFMQEAARADQQDRVLSGLLEALRVNYIIPILWRRASHDTYVGEGSTKHRKIPKGRYFAVSLSAAMYDKRRIKHPKRFDPGRSPNARLIYGHQFHYCIGASIANAALVEMFTGLLKRQPTSAKQKDRWAGAYPWNIYVRLSDSDATP